MSNNPIQDIGQRTVPSEREASSNFSDNKQKSMGLEETASEKLVLEIRQRRKLNEFLKESKDV